MRVNPFLTLPLTLPLFTSPGVGCGRRRVSKICSGWRVGGTYVRVRVKVRVRARARARVRVRVRGGAS